MTMFSPPNTKDTFMTIQAGASIFLIDYANEVIINIINVITFIVTYKATYITKIMTIRQCLLELFDFKV